MTGIMRVGVGPSPHTIQRRSLAAVAIAVILVASPPPATAQPSDASRVLTIEELLRGAGGGVAPHGPGRPVTVVGVLTAAPVAVSASNVVGYIEDATGAVQLFWRDATQAATNLQAGDLLEVRGTVAVYRDAPELVVAGVRRLRGGPPPRPRDVTVAELHDPRLAATLVRLTGTLVVPPDFSQSNKGLTLRDRSGEIPVFVPARLFRDVRFAAQVLHGGSVVLIGIADPRDAPAGAGASRVIVGTAQDLQFIVASQTWLTVVAIVVTSAAAVAYFWWRRREADRRAHALTALTENLTRSEDALRRSEGRLRAFIDGAAFGIYRATLEGRFLEVNPALVAMLGYGSAEELASVTLQIDVYQRPADRDRLIEECRARGEIRNEECVWKRKNDRLITVRLSGRLARDLTDGAEVFEIIAEDVTEQHALEAQLRSAQKLETIGRLAGGIAHDFNNLLTAILGYSELLMASEVGTSPHRADLEEIHKAARRAAALTAQLLSFSRRQVLAPKVVGVAAAVRNLVPMLGQLLSEDVELVTRADEEGLGVKVDPSQLDQVLINLAVNARDAMPTGGVLTIETATIDVTGAEASAPPGAYVRLRVQDTGIGMDAHTKAHLFEPFFTTKGIGKGTGLGLSTVYGIVKQSDGHIHIDSQPGQGTTVDVYLPRMTDALDADTAAPPTAPPLSGSETILLVEDEEGVRRVIATVLRRHGYSVLEAADGDEAIALVQQHPEPVHLLLTDVVMPGVSGRDLAEQLQRIRPAIKTLYISGHTEDAVLRHGIMTNQQAFLQKPFSRDQLLQKVREVVGGPPGTASVSRRHGSAGAVMSCRS